MEDRIKTFLKELKIYGIENDIPNVTEYVGQFLNDQIRKNTPKNILEIGCANGYSTIWMAEAAQSIGAKIHSIDFSEPSMEEARSNISKVGFEDCVNLYLGNALDLIKEFPSDLQFDFVFVDGQKKKYIDFWNAIQLRLSEKAVIVFDDMKLFSDKTKSLSDAVEKLTGFDKQILPDGDDAILVLTKNNNE
ncbi:class I SAM-dependent methyltransferase [Candidatus Peregrinibacteria bacterium]|nr:class I SAM-dependent methyltransferase [Candidatus Peregrinibacteria bacterium]